MKVFKFIKNKFIPINDQTFHNVNNIIEGHGAITTYKQHRKVVILFEYLTGEVVSSPSGKIDVTKLLEMTITTYNQNDKPIPLIFETKLTTVHHKFIPTAEPLYNPLRMPKLTPEQHYAHLSSLMGQTTTNTIIEMVKDLVLQIHTHYVTSNT